MYGGMDMNGKKKGRGQSAKGAKPPPRTSGVAPSRPPRGQAAKPPTRSMKRGK